MKTALVTAASRGIGRATAVRLGRDGFRVAVNYARDEAAAKETVRLVEEAGGSAFAVRAELGAEGGVERLAEAIDTLDVLVNNVGIGLHEPFGEVTQESYDRMFAVNVRAPFFLTQRLLPLIPDGGRIVNVTSGVTRIAFPDGIVYAMTKGALHLLTLNLAKQLGPRGITVNNVAPGIIDTDANAWLHEDPAAYDFAASRHALARVGTPEEIADVVAFAVSDAARFVTGTTLDATGGANL
ncbi:SDR family NAD(P)-dependent oxidoreductase [Nonomuraea sp. NPDC050556]|uniref:SDR family NAD(P)-dependent oxidoreductase n=1 Tax=Nonomuraea sp. NPDC050556 TaxID=3364369 RepID=UPI0037BDC832